MIQNSILNLIKQINEEIDKIISYEGTAIKSAIKEIFPNVVHKYCSWHVSKEIHDNRIKQIFWLLLRAEHRVIFQDLLSQLYRMCGENMPSILKNGRTGMFSRFYEGVKQNGLITFSPCESINSEIRTLKTEIPLRLFHHLELIGYNKCVGLLSIKTKMTPYYSKRLAHLNIKAQRLMIVEDESFSTSRTIIDSQY